MLKTFGGQYISPSVLSYKLHIEHQFIAKFALHALFVLYKMCLKPEASVKSILYQGSYKYASLSRVSNTLGAQHPFPFRYKLEKALRGLYQIIPHFNFPKVPDLERQT